MKKLFILLSLSLGLGAMEDSVRSLEGAYLGRQPKCGADVELVGDNAFKITILNRKGEVKGEEIVPFHHFTTALPSGDFSYFKEYFGERGKEKVTVEGKIRHFAFTEIKMRKSSGFFRQKFSSCLDMAPIF